MPKIGGQPKKNGDRHQLDGPICRCHFAFIMLSVLVMLKISTQKQGETRQLIPPWEELREVARKVGGEYPKTRGNFPFSLDYFLRESIYSKQYIVHSSSLHTRRGTEMILPGRKDIEVGGSSGEGWVPVLGIHGFLGPARLARQSHVGARERILQQ